MITPLRIPLNRMITIVIMKVASNPKVNQAKAGVEDFEAVVVEMDKIVEVETREEVVVVGGEAEVEKQAPETLTINVMRLLKSRLDQSAYQ